MAIRNFSVQGTAAGTLPMMGGVQRGWYSALHHPVIGTTNTAAVVVGRKSRVLAVTFTKKAATKMQERLNTLPIEDERY